MIRLQTGLERLGPPTVVFLLARAFLVRASSWTQSDGLTAGAWSRWDSAHYLSIAANGYEFFSCARVPGYNPADFCGNTGWFPGFPLLIRLLSALHVDPVVAGSWIAAVFAFATLVFVWNAFLGARLSGRTLLTLLLIAFFPGHVYQHAVFPVSICAFFQTAALHAHATKRYALAGALGGVAAFSYGSGLFLAGVFGLDLLLTIRRTPWTTLLRRIVAGPGLVAAGFGLAMLVQRLDVGVWHGYFAVQAKYHYKPTLPWQVLEPHFSAVLSGRLRAPSVQTAFVSVLIVSLLWAAARPPKQEHDRLLGIFLLAFWIIPLSLGGNLSLYRAEALLLPGASLGKKLPVLVLAALVAVSVVIAFRMALLFFRNTLV